MFKNMSSDIIYRKYNSKLIVIYADKVKFVNELHAIGAKWYPQLTDGAGWLLPIEHEQKLRDLIHRIKLHMLPKTTKRICHTPPKRSPKPDIHEVIEDPIRYYKSFAKRSPSINKEKLAKPKIRDSDENSDVYSSSDSEEGGNSEYDDSSSASSSGVPSPSTPRKRKQYEKKIIETNSSFSKILNHMKVMERKIKDLESKVRD